MTKKDFIFSKDYGFMSTPISELLVYKPRIHQDDRGHFFESYNYKYFIKENGPTCSFVQDNQSYSTYGTLRGLHFQTGVYAQSKLVRVIKGRVFDVAVDLRVESPTFGKHFGLELSSENNLQLFIPRGFAHGFLVLSEEAEFAYKVDNFYSKENEDGIIFNDKELAITWPLPSEHIVLSEKDRVLKTFISYKHKMRISL